MNFIDAFEAAGVATPAAGEQPETSLNEEVSQVVGQLSRFWGGFKKQSQTAFQAARKDFGEVVSQAQKEISKLTSEVSASTTTADASEGPAEQPTARSPTVVDSDSTASVSASTSTISASDSSTTHTQAQSSQPQEQTLLSRLQASLPPNLVSSVQKQLPDSIKHARAGSLSALDFAQLRSTLERVQGATGEYVQRSEGFLRDAGEFLRDAVRVIPPEAAEGGTPGVIWDGSDVWMLPTEGAGSAKGKGKEREDRTSSSSGSRRPSVDTLRAVATRAESLLKQLRHDPEVIKADPEADERAGELYNTWVASEVETREGGIESQEWQHRVEEALNDPVDGWALRNMVDTLVPAVMSAGTFWTRYFFRVYQVEREEERRKALIQGTIENEEDFSWEDDEEDTTLLAAKARSQPDVSTSDPAPERPSRLTAVNTTIKSRVSTPGDGSPRVSSEDSYDVVSSQVSNIGSASGTEVKIEKEDAAGAEEKSAADDDADSDWE
ncbi:hypothetical protein AcW1_003754 [Taiwanofungus camphoratus]|nr:hypothetical protein AcV5_003568 [Antrodia cinnamomea]KAI0940599.1 hypothetical protein AcW1_003754 [Antrodia cinnamomea]KAI0958226.1 hypothetical protein AcV7_004100 [Antrodia cinnamomea]